MKGLFKKGAVSSLLALSLVAAAIPVHAISNVSVVLSETEIKKISKYTVTFTLDADLNKWDKITVEFPQGVAVPSSIDKNDITINGKAPQRVRVNGNDVELDVDEDIKKENEVKVIFTSEVGIKNPSNSDRYTVYVSTKNESRSSATFRVDAVGSASNSINYNFQAKLSTNVANQTSSLKIDLDTGSATILGGSKITVLFPRQWQIPSVIDREDVRINGYEPTFVKAGNDSIDLTIPQHIDGERDVVIEFKDSARLVNPRESENYIIKILMGDLEGSNKTEFTSERFYILSGYASNIGKTVNYILDHTLSGTPTGAKLEFVNGVATDIRAVDDYIAIVMPKDFELPKTLLPSNVTINDQPASLLKVAGNTLYVHPSQFIKSNSYFTLVIKRDSGLKIDKAGQYKMQFFTSYDSAMFPNAPQFESNLVKVTAGITNKAKPVSVILRLGSTVAKTNDKVNKMDVAPYMKSNRTLVPIRFVSEAIGANVNYDEVTRNIGITYGGQYIEMKIGSPYVIVNGNAWKMAVTPEIRNGRMMVPVRFIAETFLCDVEWEKHTQSVIINRY